MALFNREIVPTRTVGSLRRDMDDLISSFFGEGIPLSGRDSIWTPALDVEENENEFLVIADLPGLEQKDISVKMSGDTLTIKGERKEEREERKKNYHVVERSSGRFLRTLSIPVPIDTEKISADYKQGVLRITLPKKPENRPKEIQVKVG